MFFRRELDFDELIESIDQLADEQIDEVVDWQMTASPAAKREGIKGTSDARRTAEALGNRAIQYGGQLAGILAEGMQEALRNPPGPSRPRERLQRELPPGRQRFVIPEPMSLQSFGDPTRDGSRLTPMRVQTIETEVQTMYDPIQDVLHIRLMWMRDGDLNRQYKQVAFSQGQIMSLRAPVVIMRENNIAPGHDVIVEIAPVLGPDGLPRMRCILESDR